MLIMSTSVSALSIMHAFLAMRFGGYSVGEPAIGSLAVEKNITPA
jgi:hypothetical protein